jgi:hypothetical protein
LSLKAWAFASGYQADFLKICAEELKTTAFADTVVLYAPLPTKRHAGNLATIKLTIEALACIQILNNGQSVPVRGAVEVGWAGPLKNGEIYGAATALAHHLESRCAKFPRIVVGPNLISFLDLSRTRLQASGEFGTCDSFYKSTKGFIKEDGAGVSFVDYLCSQSFNLLGPEEADDCGGLAIQNVRAGLEFAKKQHAKYINDPKLKPRYAALVDYYESNIHIWR